MQNQLPPFSDAAILVIGDIMLDRYWFGDAARISPEAPVPVVNIKQIDERPGGAGNVALNIAALGAKVTLIGIAGFDANAETLKAQLTAAHVAHDILQLNNMPTITKLRVISRHQQLLRLDFEENFPAFQPDALLQLFKKQLSSVNLVILSDYGKGTLTSTKALIQLAHQAKVPVLVDPKGTDFGIYQGADIITPNLKEFEAVVGACISEKDIEEKGQAFGEDRRGSISFFKYRRRSNCSQIPAVLEEERWRYSCGSLSQDQSLIRTSHSPSKPRLTEQEYA